MGKSRRDADGVETTSYAGEPIRIGLIDLRVKCGKLTGSREDGKPVRFSRKEGAIYVVYDWLSEKLDTGSV